MILFVADMFAQDYVGGAELTTEAIISDSYIPVKKIHSQFVNIDLMKKNHDKIWIFGNFSNLDERCILYAVKNLNYFVLEYDYKYCLFRSPEKHISASGTCDCETSKKAKLISAFYKKALVTWFMSESQRQKYISKFSFLNSDNVKVLSSVFSRQTLDILKNTNIEEKNDKWIILNSPSWIKGVSTAVKHAEENNLDYELVWGLEHLEFLAKMAKSKGVIYLPPGGDTCPRFIIEAKILGCELIINENVQHKNESWFGSRDTILEYLEERTKVFWGAVEDTTSELDVNDGHYNTKYNIIVPFYNAEKWISKCIRSVKEQRYGNFQCTLIDDMSTDQSAVCVERLIKDDNRFKLIKNEQKNYALKNIAIAIDESSNEDDDVIILLDGDDWLSSTMVLSRLNEEYDDKDCYVTYGSYVAHPDGWLGPEPSQYPDEVIQNNTFREDRWRASHLRTFRYKMWRSINHDDLKDSDGDYYKMAYDQAIMLPILEMASERSVYIPDILHVYNRSNPLNVDKIKQRKQYLTALEIRGKSRYGRSS
jgi:hypothetical protein